MNAGLAGAGPLSFSEESLARGLDFPLADNFFQYGAGSMLADLDGDGDLDILMAGGANNELGVFENDGTGHFTNQTESSGLTPIDRASGIAGADYDNDGDLDFFVSGFLTTSRLYRNDGNFTFTDVAAQAGVDISCPAFASSWSDIDFDGDLDFYVSVRTNTNLDPTRNFMFINNGDGTFTDMAGPMGIDGGTTPTLLCAFFDYDRDGDDDLYLGTDKGDHSPLHNFLFRNDNGVFTDITDAANAYANVDCMGIAVGDLNFDGKYDLYMTNTQPGNKLFMNDGLGVFSDQTVAAGMGSYNVGWGTVFADFDNDTELDTYLCNMLGPNRLYRGSQTWPLIDEGASAGVDEATNVFCVSVGDVDGDNDLDMLVGATEGQVNLYINNSADAATNNWVRFDVIGHNSNSQAIGACVNITADAKNQVRQVRAGTNYKTHDEYTLHFGLGASDTIDDMYVLYTGNTARRDLTNVPVNRTWTIYPESMLGDPNGNGRIDYFELFEAIASRTGPGNPIEPGLEIYDMDGDFDLDNDDLALMDLGIRTPTRKNLGVGP